MMTKCKKDSSGFKQAGLSLIELMVAMVLGLVLIGGVIEIYVNSKQTYRNQDALSRLQENGRHALNVLSTNIRPAGYAGCANLEHVDPNVIADPPIPATFTENTAVTGNENTGTLTWAPALAANVSADVADSDVITVSRAGDCGANLIGNLSPSNANIQINGNNTCGVVKDQAVMISDCEAADVFKVVNNPSSSTSGGKKIQTLTHSNGGNNGNLLSKLYQEDAEVLVFTSYTYFVKENSSGVPSLYVLDNTRDVAAGTNPLELVEGVENMQIKYGVDSGLDGVADKYIDANSVTAADWKNVVSVRLSLLLRTMENVGADDFTDAQFSASAYSGGFLRQVYVSTIKLRNRGTM